MRFDRERVGGGRVVLGHATGGWETDGARDMFFGDILGEGVLWMCTENCLISSIVLNCILQSTG